jgi:serine/threonine protein phosphatase 1
MAEIYQRIDGSKYRNIFIVGDLHGCFNRLMAQLEELHFDRERDLLISVGDLIDRGPQSLECLELIREEWFACVRGNHEQMAIEAMTGKTDGLLWFHNGGDWFSHLDEEKMMQAHKLILRASFLPYVIELATNGKTIVIAHADYPSDVYEFGGVIDKQRAVWDRARFNALTEGQPAGIEGADAFYFGHTPIQHAAKAGNLNYIDTGAVFGNLLTIVQVQGGSDAQSQAAM